tara:strand:+ start:286 stop:471 length:186 start_codon:yes stop_codon:yes gene_type:complete
VVAAVELALQVNKMVEQVELAAVDQEVVLILQVVQLQGQPEQPTQVVVAAVEKEAQMDRLE